MAPPRLPPPCCSPLSVCLPGQPLPHPQDPSPAVPPLSPDVSPGVPPTHCCRERGPPAPVTGTRPTPSWRHPQAWALPSVPVSPFGHSKSAQVPGCISVRPLPPPPCGPRLPPGLALPLPGRRPQHSAQAPAPGCPPSPLPAGLTPPGLTCHSASVGASPRESTCPQRSGWPDSSRARPPGLRPTPALPRGHSTSTTHSRPTFTCRKRPLSGVQLSFSASPHLALKIHPRDAPKATRWSAPASQSSAGWGSLPEGTGGTRQVSPRHLGA